MKQEQRSEGAEQQPLVTWGEERLAIFAVETAFLLSPMPKHDREMGLFLSHFIMSTE